MGQDKPVSETNFQHQHFLKLWDLCEELLLVQIENARGIYVVILIS